MMTLWWFVGSTPAYLASRCSDVITLSAHCRAPKCQGFAQSRVDQHRRWTSQMNNRSIQKDIRNKRWKTGSCLKKFLSPNKTSMHEVKIAMFLRVTRLYSVAILWRFPRWSIVGWDWGISAPVERSSMEQVVRLSFQLSHPWDSCWAYDFSFLSAPPSSQAIQNLFSRRRRIVKVANSSKLVQVPQRINILTNVYTFHSNG